MHAGVSPDCSFAARPLRGWLDSGVRAARIAFGILLLSVSNPCSAVAPMNGAVGLWQFPDRGVWIQVKPDGSAFQCRYAPSGTLFKSEGRFVAPDAIEWQDIWGKDQVSVADGMLTLSGKWGTFAYGVAKDPMYERCSAQHRAR